MHRSPARLVVLSLAILLLGCLAVPAACGATEILIYGESAPAPTWPTAEQWEARSRFNDGIDGGAQVDLVGGSGAAYSGLYVYDSGMYLYFRIRVNYASAFGGTDPEDAPWWGSDTVWVMIDGNGDHEPDYALAWDAKSKNNSTHGLEFQIRNPGQAGSSWGDTQFYDIDMHAADKIVSPDDCDHDGSCYHYDIDQNGEGYVRVTDGQQVCDSPWSACDTLSDTAYIDIAVEWDYIIGATAPGYLGRPALTQANAGSWNLQLGTRSNANDHNFISTDIAAGFSPDSTGEGGNPPWGGTLGGDPPTLVELGDFYALAEGGVVIVRWETFAEVDHVGFHLWRKDLGSEAYTRLTEARIPAEGSPVQGASYRYEDGGVEPETAYLYLLEDVDVSGASRFHGPVSAFVPPVGMEGWAPAEAEASSLEAPRPGTSRKLGFVLFLGLPVVVVLGWMRCRLGLQIARERGRAPGSDGEPGPPRV